MNILSKTVALIIIFSPVVLSAQNMVYFTQSATGFGQFLVVAIPVAIAIALLVFFWGLVKYITVSGDDTARQDGKNKMIRGVLALFIIVSVWGVVALLQGITGVGSRSNPLPYPGS